MRRKAVIKKLSEGRVEPDARYIPPMPTKRFTSVSRGGEAFVPTLDQREGVAQLRSCGWQIPDIAKAMRIPLRTLERHFKEELTDGAAFVRGMVSRGIARGALAGDKTLMIFYAKSQMGWVDTKPWGYGDKGAGGGGGTPLFTVNIMGLGGGQTSITATGPTIEATPDNTK